MRKHKKPKYFGEDATTLHLTVITKMCTKIKFWLVPDSRKTMVKLVFSDVYAIG